VRGAPAAEMYGQIAPRRARPDLPDNRVNEKLVAMIAVAADRARATGKQVFNPVELVVQQSIALVRKPPGGRLFINYDLSDFRIP